MYCNYCSIVFCLNIDHVRDSHALLAQTPLGNIINRCDHNSWAEASMYSSVANLTSVRFLKVNHYTVTMYLGREHASSVKILAGIANQVGKNPLLQCVYNLQK